MLISLTGIVSIGLSSFPVWIRTRCFWSKVFRKEGLYHHTPFSRVQTPNSADVLFHLVFPPNPLAGLWIGAAGCSSCWRRIIYKTMLQTNERTCWPSVAGLYQFIYLLSLCSTSLHYDMRGETAETLESKRWLNRMHVIGDNIIILLWMDRALSWKRLTTQVSVECIFLYAADA